MRILCAVKLEYKWSDQQLTFLMRHARNDFSRWDAAQSLLATYIKLNVARHQQAAAVSAGTCADAFRAVLLDEKIDPALAAEILTLLLSMKWLNCSISSTRLLLPKYAKHSLVRLATELADELLVFTTRITRASTVLSMKILQNALCVMPACASLLLVKRIWLTCW